MVLSLDEGLGFRTALDVYTADLVQLLDGTRPLREVLEHLAGGDAERFDAAALPAVRRLLELGFLVRVADR